MSLSWLGDLSPSWGQLIPKQVCEGDYTTSTEIFFEGEQTVL